ncbi:MAG TPA: TIGR03564 family F420-dependent LLM class oxidoreductase [Microbacteriaceae bacterium]|nr:TIGR03564 family F420-dependent LLM class oxidoreductase [Microbacteriaceae bacterium]
MRISVLIGAQGETIDRLLDVAVACEEAGLHGVWYGQFLGYDAPTIALAAAAKTERLVPGVAVVTARPRHPIAVAAQAQTVNALSGNRHRLAIGLSHRSTIEGIYGLDFPSPAKYLREYLQVLGDLVAGRPVDFNGEFVSAHGQLGIPEAGPLPLYTGALGPLALEVTGELADGTVTYLAGPRTIEEHVMPRMLAGAARSGRGRPELVACVPVLATDDPASITPRLHDFTRFHASLPEYQQIIAREGIDHPGDMGLIGGPEVFVAGAKRLRDAGATELGAALFGDREEQLRTIRQLGEIAAQLR